MSDLSEAANAIAGLSQDAKDEIKMRLEILEQQDRIDDNESQFIAALHRQFLVVLLALLFGLGAFGSWVLWFTLSLAS